MSNSTSLSNRISLSISGDTRAHSKRLNTLSSQVKSGLSINQAGVQKATGLQSIDVNKNAQGESATIREKLNALIASNNMAETVLQDVSSSIMRRADASSESDDSADARGVLRDLSHQLVDSIFDSSELREKTQAESTSPEMTHSTTALHVEPTKLVPKLQDDFAGVREQLGTIVDKISEERLEREDGLVAVGNIDQAALFVEAVSLVVAENKEAAVEAQANLTLEKVVSLLDMELD